MLIRGVLMQQLHLEVITDSNLTSIFFSVSLLEQHECLQTYLCDLGQIKRRRLIHGVARLHILILVILIKHSIAGDRLLMQVWGRILR